MPRDSSDNFKQHDIELAMIEEENRLQSFENGKWPYLEDCVCTPRKMAEAGFYHQPTPQIPDGVRCFSCLKELEGWDPDDDPWKEHRKHTIAKGRDCEFIRLGKPQSEMTVEEFLKVMQGRHLSLIAELAKRKKEHFDNSAEKVRKEMEKLGKMLGK